MILKYHLRLKKHQVKNKYMQKFKTSGLDYLNFMSFKAKSGTKAYCKICDCDLVCGITELLKHQKRTKQSKKLAVISQCTSMSTFINKNQTHCIEVMLMEFRFAPFLQNII